MKNYEEAQFITNDRQDELSPYISTQNIQTITYAVQHIEVGTLSVNKPIVGYIQGYHSGHKRSGTGGEDGIYGLENYLQKRTVYFNYE